MKTRTRRLAVAVVSASAVLVPAGTAFADAAVPYADPAVSGRLTLCDAAGSPITSGSIDARPFASTVVSDVAAPGLYAGPGRRATLVAYQPREGTEPEEWSGQALTATSTYSRAAHPMAAATAVDDTLADFLDVLPTRWDGWVQLRLVLSAPDAPPRTERYEALDIHVHEGTWTAVGTGSASCTAGTATSLETAVLPRASLVPTPSPSVAVATGDAAPVGAGSPGGRAPAAASAAAADVASQAASRTEDPAGPWGRLIPIAVAASLIVAALLSLRRRPRRSTAEDTPVPAPVGRTR